MSKLDVMRALVNQMLTTAIETLFVEFQKKITEYEDEIVCLKEENESKRKLLDKVLNPVVRLHKAVFQESVSGTESEASPAWQQLNPTERKHLEPETKHAKEEPEEPKEPEEGVQKVEDLQRNPIDEIEEDNSLFWRFLSEIERRPKDVGASAQGPQHKAPSAQSQGQGSKQVPTKCHKCTMCSKGFPTRSKLNVHMRVHTGEKPYACQQCGACFTQSGSLQVHKKIHSGLRPYRCPICNKGFGVKDTLKKHAHVHAVNKPFSCSTCGKKFNFKEGLAGHLRHRVKGKPLGCYACGQEFCTKYDLEKHLLHHCPNMRQETEPQGFDEGSGGR